MRTLLCCIAKQENRYLREFIEWYKSIGFTNVCLYDNNDPDGERFEEVIGDYIDDGFVIVKDWRGNKNKPQIPSYQSCYDEYGNSYDWIAFFDVDEFLEFDNGKNVEDFLKEDIFKNAQFIRVCWKNFSDNGLVRVENNDYSRKRFTKTIDERSVTSNFANRGTKIIVRGGINGFKFINQPGGEHGWGLPFRGVDCHGNECTNEHVQLHILKEKIWDNAWLCHYRFRTMEEYCKFKVLRGYANMDENRGKNALSTREFFDYNEWTKEKQDLFNELVGKSRIICCILNYNKDENTMLWYKRCRTAFNTWIIDTNYVDNGGESKVFPKDDPNILLCHNLYFGGSCIKSYEIYQQEDGLWLMMITSDVECDDVNFKFLVDSVNDVVSRDDIGVWEPAAKMGSMCNGSTMPIFTNIHQYNHGTRNMRDVRCGEGWFEFVNGKVADYVLSKLNFKDNKYGWGINDMFNRAARKMGLRVVIDDRVTMLHPHGTGYNNKAAAAEYEEVKKKFKEFGLMETEKKKEDIKTLVCCIGKNENRYIREYVDWYKNIGVTNICLYDNNDVDGERFEDIIGKDIEEGYIIYNDWRGRKNCQLDAYQECYDRFKDTYDWILFIDCGDEYLDFVRPMSIKDFLSMPQFVNYDEIHLNLMTYGDSDVPDYKEGTLKERFPQPIPYDTNVAYNFPEDCHVSTIVRGGLEKVEWKGVTHTPSNPLRCCNAVGISVDPLSPFTFPYNFDLAFFRHYTTKTAREYAWKMQRGFPDQIWDGSRIKNLVETRFFRTNRVTEEKVNIFKEELGIDMSYLIKNAKIAEGKSKDVKIFTLCYSKKEFEFINNKYVTPLQVGAANGTDVCELKDNTGENISSSNFFYIENTGTYWIWRNVKDAKYKGQMQYRRPLIGIDENTDFEKIFSQYDVITCKPFHHPDHMKPTEDEPMVIPASTVEGGYAFSNCLPDLLLMENIVKQIYPDYAADWDKYIKNGEDLYYSSGFIMRSNDYDRYCEFLFNCLSNWIAASDIRDILDLYTHVAKNLGAGKYIRYPDPMNVPREAVKWQTEIGGFLGERLWTLWVQHNFKPDKIYKLPYKKMEEGMYT